MDLNILAKFNKFMHDGYVDYICGRPFRADYDRLDQAKQMNYEAGRLQAANDFALKTERSKL